MSGWNELFLQSRPLQARCEEAAGMESRRLSGRRSGPLRRVPHTDKYFRREPRRARRLQGGTLQDWFAPSLAGDLQFGLGSWSADDIVPVPQDRPQCQDRCLRANVGGHHVFDLEAPTMQTSRRSRPISRTCPHPLRRRSPPRPTRSWRKREKQSTSTIAPRATGRMAKASPGTSAAQGRRDRSGWRSDNGYSRDSRRGARRRDGRASDAIGHAVLQVEAFERRGRGEWQLRPQHLGQRSARNFSFRCSINETSAGLSEKIGEALGWLQPSNRLTDPLLLCKVRPEVRDDALEFFGPCDLRYQFGSGEPAQ